MQYQELLDRAELNGSVSIPTPPKFESVRLYSVAGYKSTFGPYAIKTPDEFNFILVGDECDEGINTAEDLKAALPPMGA